jgi:hypothetical protein
MNAQAAFQQFAGNVASAPEDHWLQALCSEGQALIRRARDGLLPQEDVENEIARVANRFDVAGKVGAAEADTIWELLRQAKGEIAIPEPTPAPPDDDEIRVANPDPAEPEPEPIEIDPRPCERCGLTIDKHIRIDTPEGPEFDCDPRELEISAAAAAARLRMELNDPRDRGMAQIEIGLLNGAEPPADGPEAHGLPMDGERDQALAPRLISATPFMVRDPATLPVRDILYGRHLIRGFVAGLVGIGGGGKSTLSMIETLARASGKPLLGVRVRNPLRCWSINLEDPRDEIERRAQATCLHYGLSAADIGDRLFLDSGRDQPVVVARTLAGGTQIVEPVVENIIAEIKARKIDVLTIDPFVSSHEVPENDNGAIDMVLKRAWGQVAERGHCAVELVHHLRKIGDEEPTVDAARGASAFQGALRALRVLAGMTKAEAERAGVDNPYRYFRVFSGKLNMAPREDKSDWHFLESVDLGNGNADMPSDHVQVAVPWQWPNATDGLSVCDLFAVQKRISEGQWRESAQSPDWAGKAVAEVLDLDLEDAPPQARVKSLLKMWIGSGALKVVARLDEQRKERKFVEVGQWAT